MEKLEWSALEYEEKDHSNDWFWALGVIVITAAIASIMYNNYFFAAFLILSGILLGFFGIHKPEIVHYELNERGLKIKSRLFPYEHIKSFYVQKRDEHFQLEPMFFIKSDRIFVPVISIPIEEYMVEKIHSIMTEKNVLEEKMAEHPSLQVMEFLGF